MKTRLWCLLALAMLPAGLLVRPSLADQPKGDPNDMAALQKNAEAFIEAFHKGDAKFVAGFWVADGDYTDQTGHHLKGRDAIEKLFAGFFAENKGLKLRIDSETLRFVTPDVAIEDGTTEVIHPDGAPPSRARFTNVHVKKDGLWLLSSVREAAYSPPGNYEHLKALEWVIGDWMEEGGNGETQRVAFTWSDNHNFIISSAASTFRDISTSKVTQWIGWDPGSKGIRSWAFHADGAFGEATWTREGDNKWIISTREVQQDGKKVVATNVVTRIDADTVTWQAKERAVDGNVLENSKEMKMKRVK